MKTVIVALWFCFALSALAETVSTERPISGSRPEYPLSARADRITGNGVYMLRVNERGYVVKVEIAKHSGSKMLDAAAIRTFMHWRFQPGKSLRWVRMPVSWSLAKT